MASDSKRAGEINPDKLNAFLHKMVGEMGAAANAALVVMGDKLGLYRALAGGGGMTSAELAGKTGTHERYIREWLSAQAASGYVSYDAAGQRFFMTPEQAAVFADPESPAAMAGGFYSVASLFVDEPRVTEAFRTGRGLGWGEHSDCLFCGTEKFFRPGYAAHLVNEWIPSLDGVKEKLERGARVADVGCGHGSSTMIMAKAFPKSAFVGLDAHGPSIERARALAAEERLGNAQFETAAAKEFAGPAYDLIAYFDCLHDMGDPAGALAHARGMLKPDGTILVVEPFAKDELEENLNPVGRLYFAFSAMICTPASLSQEVGLGLGAQAGPKRLRGVAEQAGFSRFRVAMATPFNLIIELRP